MNQSFLSKYRIQIGLIGLSLLIHLYIALRPADVLMNWYTSDDGFYYFKVAANIANGLGATFDGISRTNGFHPLWMLVCIPVFWLARFDLLLPLRVLVLVSALFQTGTALLLFAILRRHISAATAAAMAVVWIFLPPIHTAVVENGMESALSGFCLALLIYFVTGWRQDAVSPRRLALLGVVAGLAILARLDNVFVVLLVGAWFVLGRTTSHLRTHVLGDVGLIFIICLLGYAIRLPAGPVYIANSVALPWHLGLSFVLIPGSLYISGLYRLAPEKVTGKYLLRCLLAVTIPSFTIGAALILLQRTNVLTALPRSVLLIVWAGTLLALTGLRLLAAWIFRGQTADAPDPVRSRVFWKALLPRALGYFLPAGGMVGLYMLWSYLYVGLAMPISGTIKHWWGSLPNTVYGSVHHSLGEVFGLYGRLNAWSLAQSPWTALLNLFRPVMGASAASMAAAVLFLLVIGLALYVVLRQSRWILPVSRQAGLGALFLGLYAQIFYYSTTSYMHVRSWYWVGQALFTVLCLGLILETFRLELMKMKMKPVLWQTGMGVVCLAVLAAFGGMVVKYFPIHAAANPTEDYLTDIQSLERLTKPGALIGSTGGGTMGYFLQDRTVVNLDGLINGPRYFRLLEAGRGSEYLDDIGLDYVFGVDEMLNHSDPYYGLFKDRLEVVPGSAAVFGNGLQLYHYIPNDQERITRK